MSERLTLSFPFILAILFPPVGILLGAIEWPKDRELGMRLIAVSLLAMVVWVVLLVL
jgi:hypothetical protein